MSIPYPQSERRRQSPLKASKKNNRVFSDEDSNNEEEDAVAMLTKNFGRLMNNDKFKKKFVQRLRKVPKEVEVEDVEKKDQRGPQCFECSSFGHPWVDCGNLK
jgi:hypothetical protein